MDILAGMLAYVAGLGALFAAVAVAFVMFAATPKAPSEQSPPQSAMLLRPSTPKMLEAHAKDVSKTGRKQGRSHSERQAALPSAAQPTASRELRRKASTEQARRPIQ